MLEGLKKFAMAVLALAASGAASAEPARMALLVGISDYNGDGVIDTSPEARQQAISEGFAPDLRNPVNDVTDVGAALARAGFDTLVVTDVSRSELEEVVASFAQRANTAGPDAVVIFYFAGHGVQNDGADFLVPARARMPRRQPSPPSMADVMTDDETKVALETIFQSHEPWNSDQKQSVEKFSAALDPWLKLNGFPDSERATRIHDEFVDLSAISTLFSLRTPTNEGPGFVLLIVDNCRDNPFIDSDNSGFQKFMGKRGHLGLPGVFWGSQIVIYSTTGTQTALDGTGRNSLFAAALKRRIARPLQTLTEMMAAVSEDVRTQSNERQGPEGPISLYMDPSRLCVVSCPPLPPRAPDGE